MNRCRAAAGSELLDEDRLVVLVFMGFSCFLTVKYLHQRLAGEENGFVEQTALAAAGAVAYAGGLRRLADDFSAKFLLADPGVRPEARILIPRHRVGDVAYLFTGGIQRPLETGLLLALQGGPLDEADYG